MKRHLMIVTLLLSVMVSLLSPTTLAATPTNKGLFLSPTRNFAAIDAGKSAEGTVTVANFTESPLTVTLSVKEFSVANYSYDYIFRDVKENWLHFSQTAIQLEPGKNEPVTYVVTPPARTAPGGKYYMIVASATIKQGGVPTQVQVAVPLYITVKGIMIQTNKLASHSLSSFVIGDRIPFSLDITNTGNIHYITTITGSLSGPWTNKSTVTSTHILLPDTTRHIADSIPSPLLPGVYTATYGYSTDTSNPVTVVGHVIYTPPWLYAAVVVSGLGIYLFVRWRRRLNMHRPHPIDS